MCRFRGRFKGRMTGGGLHCRAEWWAEPTLQNLETPYGVTTNQVCGTKPMLGPGALKLRIVDCGMRIEGRRGSEMAERPQSRGLGHMETDQICGTKPKLGGMGCLGKRRSGYRRFRGETECVKQSQSGDCGLLIADCGMADRACETNPVCRRADDKVRSGKEL
jgi:hypothetical protein